MQGARQRYSYQWAFTVDKVKTNVCDVPENIHTPPTEGFLV